jgi:uncharacterized membrane protein
MKTLYLIKSFFPFFFLPIAPGVIQVELQRHGIIPYNVSPLLGLAMQVAFTLGILVWLVGKINRKTAGKAFLKMSCVSKKVFHNGRWMPVEQYLADSHNVVVSHGMTPEESDNWLRESEQYLRNERQLEVAKDA